MKKTKYLVNGRVVEEENLNFFYLILCGKNAAMTIFSTTCSCAKQQRRSLSQLQL